MLFSYLTVGSSLDLIMWYQFTKHEFTKSTYSVHLSPRSPYLMPSTQGFSPEVSDVFPKASILMLLIMYIGASMTCVSQYIWSSNYSSIKYMDKGAGEQLSQQIVCHMGMRAWIRSLELSEEKRKLVWWCIFVISETWDKKILGASWAANLVDLETPKPQWKIQQRKGKWKKSPKTKKKASGQLMVDIWILHTYPDTHSFAHMNIHTKVNIQRNSHCFLV